MPAAAGPESSGAAAGPRHAAPDGTPVPALPRLGHRARHRDRSAWPGPLVRGSLLAVALTALVATAGLVLRLTGDAATGPGTPAGDPAAPAAWLAAALPPSTDLAASAAVREELSASGVPSGRLRPAEVAAASGALLAVAGPAPPGSRVVARFDRSGGGELLVVDPTTGAGPAAADVLRSGEVDLRLLSLLAALAAREGVGVAGFPVLPAEEGAGPPARRVLIDAVGGAPVPADPAATDGLRTWLAAQLPPFRPDDLQVTDDGVLVSFHYASHPDALVADATR